MAHRLAGARLVDDDILAIGVFSETACERDELNDTHRSGQGIDAGLVHLTDDLHLSTVDLLDDDGDRWILNVLRRRFDDRKP